MSSPPQKNAEINDTDTSSDESQSSSNRQSRNPQSRLTIIAHPERRYEPFPLTDIQQAYWVGRGKGLELGGVSTHYYSEIDCHNLDLDRLTHAWRRLIARHDMLRVIILPSGQQQVLEDVPYYEFALHDLQHLGSDTVEAELQEIREEMSHHVLPSDQWPLFRIRATLLDKTHFRLHLSFDALTIDARSRQLLLREWSKLYHDPDALLPRLELTYHDFVMAETEHMQSPAYKQSDAYWENRLSSLPPAPALPLAKNPSTITQSRFIRLNDSLEPEVWLKLKKCTAAKGLRPSILLLAAFSECLKLWCKSSQRMSLNLTLFNRMARDERLSGVVGDFTSSTILAIDNEAETTFMTRALHIQDQLMQDLTHSDVSGVKVIRKLFQHQGTDFGAIMPVVFTSLLSISKDSRDTPTDWLGEEIYAITQTPQVALDHQVIEERGALIFKWDFVEELFPKGMLHDMLGVYTDFLRHLEQDERYWESPWTDIARHLLPQGHRRLYESVNETTKEFPVKLLHELFLDRARLGPANQAVISSERNLTYQQLLELSSRVGHWLKDQQVKPNTLVAIVMEKGWEQVVGVLGVLQSGAAYVPIDPTLPRERIRHLLEQSRVTIVLTQPSIDQITEWPANIIRLRVSDATLRHLDSMPLASTQNIDDLAYVIFTSGSTGTPKGVAVDHLGPANTLLDIDDRFNITPNDKVLALASLSFDLSVYDIFGTLAAGAAIVIPDASEAKDPAGWLELLRRENITLWNSVPALMKLLVEYIQGQSTTLPESLRLILLSGDWIPLTLPDNIQQLSKNTQIVSLGGATEASVWSIIYPINKIEPHWNSIPYGKPMHNQHIYVLNDALDPCPVWVTGQLFIGGTGLVKMYWRDEEKTTASFITHPVTGERLYRTGDTGRYLPDGNIEFLGREDLQVKIQGYRIELAEIESTLEHHPSVQTAIVSAIGTTQGEKRLAAYIIPDETVPSRAELHEFLRQKLPEYMIPQTFMVIEQLPLTPNGKIDRSRLPQPEIRMSPLQTGLDHNDESGIVDEVSKMITSILKVEHIDNHATLMELGVNSVDMMRLAVLIEQRFKFRPRMMELFRLRTVAAVAQYCEQSSPRQINSKTKGNPVWPFDHIVESFSVLTDTTEREAFKEKQTALLEAKGSTTDIRLPMAELTEEDVKQFYGTRRSHRTFSQETITIDQLSGLLSSLRQVTLDNKRKYAYGSAGGLYPVQTYLYLRQHRIEGIPPGIYYYHPVHHSLIPITTNAEIDNNVFGLSNRDIIDNGAFAIFLIAELKAIAPVYDDLSYKFCLIESGLMTQLLESNAPENNIGLCQVGNVDFDQVRHLFALENSQIFLHALIGGVMQETNVPTDIFSGEKLDIITPKQRISPSKNGLILIQDQGNKTPFFCVYGNVRLLANYLDPKQPVYWFWSHHQSDIHHLSHDASIEEIAALYLKDIKEIQPEGPYLIGGFCVGASIAYEIAQQLGRENKKVDLLVLIDPYSPGHHSLQEKVLRELNKISRIDGHFDKISYLSTRAGTLSKRIIGRYIKKRDTNNSTANQTSSEPRLYVHPTAIKALLRYQPQAYKGPTLLFCPGRQNIFYTIKKRLGPPAHWTNLLTGDVKTFVIPEAGHEQLFNEPFVRNIAEKLNLYLNSNRKISK